MIILNYKTKKELKESIGKPLRYRETSLFGAEYVSNGFVTGCNRPHLTGYKREFFARVQIENDKIKKVS
tara:strand:+ start:540 stop:746 length:207 start_codon:yes stop_codon:yes gene_type:complete